MSSRETDRTTAARATYPGLSLALGPMTGRVEERLGRWREERFAERMWDKDWTLWSKTDVPELADRLGWLDLPAAMEREAAALEAFGREVAAEGFERFVLLGMGGSSLAAEVFQETFGNGSGHPPLTVLDSTHPAAVARLGHSIDPTKTLFLVASKSGSTIETLSLFRYFFQEVAGRSMEPGSRFVAITDPGSELEKLAGKRHFRRIFLAPPDVGGRYSALSVFGLVPAAAIGVDVGRLLERAREAHDFRLPAPDNGALALGAALGELAGEGIDKLTFFASPALASVPAWIEQLVAESTGKGGQGIVPVVGEPALGADRYGADRLFVHLRLAGDGADAAGGTGGTGELLATLEERGHPVVRIELDDRHDLGRELLRWEIAVAAAGAAMGLQPFDQPDVELAKRLAKEAMAESRGGGARFPGEIRLGTDGAAAPPDGEPEQTARMLRQAVSRERAELRPGDYLSIQAYLPPTPETRSALERLREALARSFQLPTTTDFGPRFLHSTGQLHKGGPGGGIFLQIVDDPAPDLAIPETAGSFDELVRAQALGDARALAERERRLIRVHLGPAADPAGTAARIDRLTQLLAPFL